MNNEYVGDENIDLFDFQHKKRIKMDSFVLTPDAFNKALRKCGFNMLPNEDLLLFLTKITTNIKNLNEVCMFLSIVFYRTRGLVQFEERLAPGNSYLDMIYRDMQIDRAVLHLGRGHMLLKSTSNYVLVSQTLGHGQSIAYEPEVVKDMPEISTSSAIIIWQSAFEKYDFSKSTYCQAMSRIWYKLEKRMPTRKQLLDMYTYYFRMATLFEVQVIYLEFFATPKKTFRQKIMLIIKRFLKIFQLST